MSKPISDRVVRIYEVILWADDLEDGEYEPFTITLGYPSADVPDDAYSDEVKAEALKVARKAEIRNGHMDADSTTVLELTGLRLKGSKLIPAHETFEAGAPRPS